LDFDLGMTKLANLEVLCDPRAEFTRRMFPKLAKGEMLLNRRYSVLIDSGNILAMNVEKNGESVVVSGPNRILDQLIAINEGREEDVGGME
jgi:peroxiredoxin